MPTSLNGSSVADLEMRLYQERTRAETWKNDHDEALRCLIFEQHLALGISAFNLILRCETAWRARVSAQQVPFEPEVEDAFQGLYASWLELCPNLLKQLEGFEDLDYIVAGAEDFRTCCRDAEGLVGPPDVGDPIPEPPPPEVLKALAKRHPPPPEWFEGVMRKPF